MIKIIPERLKKVLKLRGISQELFAEYMDVNLKTVSNWCNNYSMPASDEQIKKIHHLLGINPEFLTGEIDDPEPRYLIETDIAEYNLLKYLSSGRGIAFQALIVMTGEEKLIPCEALLQENSIFSFSERFAYAVKDGERVGIFIYFVHIQTDTSRAISGYSDFVSLMYQIQSQLDFMLTPERIGMTIKTRLDTPFTTKYIYPNIQRFFPDIPEGSIGSQTQ